jgi:hypothetical protein
MDNLPYNQPELNSWEWEIFSPIAGYPAQLFIAGTCFKQLIRPAPQSARLLVTTVLHHNVEYLLVVSQGPLYTG